MLLVVVPVAVRLALALGRAGVEVLAVERNGHHPLPLVRLPIVDGDLAHDGVPVVRLRAHLVRVRVRARVSARARARARVMVGVMVGVMVRAGLSFGSVFGFG